MDKAAIHRCSLRGARRSVEWIMRGEDVYRSERIQKRAEEDGEESGRGCGEAVGWREVSSKVLTRRGGRGKAAAGGVATRPPASFTPPPLSFPPSSPGQNRGELCHRGCRTISRGLGESCLSGWTKHLEAFFPLLPSPLLTGGNRFLVELSTFVQRSSEMRRIGKMERVFLS